MIEAHIVEVVVMVDAGTWSEPLKIKWSSIASEIDDKTIEKDLHLDVKTTRTSNTTTVKNLNTMPQIAGTELKILPISPKQQMMWVITLLFFFLMMIQVFRMMFGTLTRVLATIC